MQLDSEYFFECPEHGEYPDEFFECPICASIDRDIDHWKEDKKGPLYETKNK